MHGRLRIDVSKTKALLVLENNLGWDFARCNTLEQRFFLTHEGRVLEGDRFVKGFSRQHVGQRGLNLVR